MLAALDLVATVPMPATLDAVITAFDSACVAPGANVAAQRDAVTAMKAVPEAKQSTAPAALEGYDLGSIGFLIIPGAKGSTCGVTATVSPEVTGEQIVSRVTSRYGATLKVRNVKRVQSGFWKVADGVFTFELSDQNGFHVLLLSALSKGT